MTSIVRDIREFYRNLHYQGRVGVWIGLFVIGVVGFYFTAWEAWQERQVTPREFPGLAVLSTGERVNTLRLSSAAAAGVSELQAEFRSLSPEIRDRVIQRLGEFRVEYKQQWPSITVETAPDAEAAHRVANELIQMLARFGMNGRVEKALSGQAPAAQPLILWCSPDNVLLAYTLLSAIAPYIQSEAAVVKDPSYPASRMRLRMDGGFRFAGNGAVVLSED